MHTCVWDIHTGLQGCVWRCVTPRDLSESRKSGCLEKCFMGGYTGQGVKVSALKVIDGQAGRLRGSGVTCML